MRLTHIRVAGCGRFLDPVMVTGFEPGLNVLAAPNEAGKSTLFRAVRACVFERHTSSAEAVRRLACEGASVPLSIEIGFERAGSTYVARKTFLSSRRASLERDGREIASARAADDALYELLGLKPGSGRSIDEGAFGLLWVGQREAISEPTPEGAARNALEAAIEREVGGLVGGEGGRNALRDIDAELAKTLTPRGLVAINSPLGALNARLRDLVAQHDEAGKLLAELERDFDLLEAKRRERAQASDPTLAADLRKSLEEARRELQAATELERETRSLAQQEELARKDYEAAAGRLKELRDCAQRIDEAFEARAGFEARLGALSAHESACLAEIASAEAAVRDLDQTDARDQQAQTHLRRLAQIAAAAALLPETQRRLSQLETSAQERARISAALAPLRVTAKDVQALERIERDAGGLRARMEAGSSRIEIAPLEGAAGRIRIDGEPVGGALARAATRRMTISIEGVGEIVVTPPPGFGEAERERMAALEAQRAQLFARAGVADEDELRAHAQKRAELDAQLATLLARLAAFDVAEDALGAEIAALTERVASVRGQIAKAFGESGEAPDAAAIEAKEEALQARRAGAVSERERLRALLEGHNRRRLKIAADAAREKAAADALDLALRNDLAQLPQNERAMRIEAARAAFEAARSAHERALLALEETRARAPSPDGLSKLRDRVARHEQALQNQTELLQRLGVEIGQIEGRIQSRGGEGLSERTAALAGEIAMAQRDAARLQRRTDALSLLRQTILSCYEERREQLQAPLRSRLQPFLDDLFPRAQVRLDEKFGIEGVLREGGVEAFGRLSDGTQEQIAVLVRLAMGALLRERGEDVPIILDDALVFCDDDRIEHMFDALHRAARVQQVVVLTCRGKTFRALGGRTLKIEPAPR